MFDTFNRKKHFKIQNFITNNNKLMKLETKILKCYFHVSMPPDLVSSNYRVCINWRLDVKEAANYYAISEQKPEIKNKDTMKELTNHLLVIKQPTHR